MLANGKAVARQPVPCLEAAAGGPAQLFHCKAAGHNNKGPPLKAQTHTHTQLIYGSYGCNKSSEFLSSLVHALFKVFIYPSHIDALWVSDVLWSKNFDGKLFFEIMFLATGHLVGVHSAKSVAL